MYLQKSAMTSGKLKQTRKGGILFQVKEADIPYQKQSTSENTTPLTHSIGSERNHRAMVN